MLENKKVGNYEAHLSRYIVSWRHAGGKYFYDEFEDWLKSEGLTEEEIRDAVEMATMGKLELEVSALAFVKKEQDEIKKILEEEDSIEKKSVVKDTINHMKRKIKRRFK